MREVNGTFCIGKSPHANAGRHRPSLHGIHLLGGFGNKGVNGWGLRVVKIECAPLSPTRNFKSANANANFGSPKKACLIANMVTNRFSGRIEGTTQLYLLFLSLPCSPPICRRGRGTCHNGLWHYRIRHNGIGYNIRNWKLI